MLEGITAKDLSEGVLIQYNRKNNLSCVFAPEGMTRKEFSEKVGDKEYKDFLKSYELAVTAAEMGSLAQTTITLSHIKAFGKGHELRGIDELVNYVVGEATGKYVTLGYPSIEALTDFLNNNGIQFRIK